VVAIIVVVLAAEVARLTVAAHFAADNPDLAARLAPNNPDVMASIAMRDVGKVAARGGNPGPAVLARFESLAGAAPLRPEPFLLQGVLAEKQGNLQRADSLLTQARRRNPRSIAALYLLADVSMRANEIAEALEEVGILSRLVPNLELVPSLAQFAHTPGAKDQLSTILKANPSLKRPLLNALSADATNARLILALAGQDLRSLDDGSKIWKSQLVMSFIAKGDYRQAYNVWRIFAGIPANSPPLIYNGDFKRTPAPPPFDWSYTSSGDGLAEPAAGKLRVLYYGRNDAVLASQLLSLGPGTYEFAAPAGGSGAANSLVWTLACVGSGKPLMQLAVRPSTAVRFTVPASCGTQSLALNGRSQEVPQDTDVQLGPISLRRIDG
jgi:tetratricopeptide (TPR) repeat protein